MVGVPNSVVLISNLTGSSSSFAWKYMSHLVTNTPVSSVTENVCAIGSSSSFSQGCWITWVTSVTLVTSVTSVTLVTLVTSVTSVTSVTLVTLVTLVTSVTSVTLVINSLVTFVISFVILVISVTSWVTLVITSKPLTVWIVFDCDVPPMVWESLKLDVNTLAFLIERVDSWVASTLPCE